MPDLPIYEFQIEKRAPLTKCYYWTSTPSDRIYNNLAYYLSDCLGGYRPSPPEDTQDSVKGISSAHLYHRDIPAVYLELHPHIHYRERNGRVGCLFTGKNGNQIFLPACNCAPIYEFQID